MTKQDYWTTKHQHLIEAAATPVAGDDHFQALLRQVQRDYVRLTDAETLKLSQASFFGTPVEAQFARDMLVRNAAPLALEIAYDYSTRFGGLLEAWDGALHQLNKLLPHLTNGEKPRKMGWNGLMGIRWLAWVRLKLPAEMPDTAARLVDEKRASGAPAAIASGRSRLLATTGNDAELYDQLLQPVGKTQPGKTLPKGRKNLIVKKGDQRYTRKALLRTLAPLTQNLHGKPQMVLVLSGELRPLQLTGWDTSMPAPQVRTLPITPSWVAAAVRANARKILRLPRLSDRTRQDAQRLAAVSDLWVTTNAKSHKLDAMVGEDGDERLADIIASEPQSLRRFEAPLHRIDEIRALSAYKRYGPLYGDALTRLPVRQLLPIQRTRLRERAVREAFAAFCERAGQPARGHEMVQAAQFAVKHLAMEGQPHQDIWSALRGVQDALRGRKSAHRVSPLGQGLQAALMGTPLQVVSKHDQEIARDIRRAFPKLRFTFSLAAAYGYGLKLSRQGKADRLFVEACRKAGIRIKVAEDALALVKDMPLATRKGERMRVTTGKGYVRPWQLALEGNALSIGARADAARTTVLRLQAELPALEAATEQASTEMWLAQLDTVQQCRAQLALAERVSETFLHAAEALEESCETLNLNLALKAIVDADELLDDHMALQNPEAWWSQAYFALGERPAPVGQVLFDEAVPF